MNEDSIAVQTQALTGESKAEDGTTVLTYHLAYPLFRGARYGRALDALNRRYQAEAERSRREVMRELYPAALEQYRFDKDKGFPFNPYEAYDVFVLTYSQRCILSLYFDRYRYTGGAHGNTVRSADSWDLQRQRRLALRDFVYARDPRAYVIGEITAQADKEPQKYFEDYRTLIQKTFDPRNFYATPEGLVVYFQQYDISTMPRIPSFSVRISQR